MAKAILVVLFVVATNLLSLSNVHAIDKEREVEKTLKLLNKPPIKSIKSEDGDIIDCVDIYKQPAFNHPLLKNHTIQMKPSFHLTRRTTNSKRKSRYIHSQIWRKSGSCPEGTVPIRRIRKEDVLRANSLEQFGKKNDHFVHIKNTSIKMPGIPDRAQALLYTSAYNFIEAEGDLSVHQPHIDLPEDYSRAVVTVRNGDELIEAGWMVNPKLYGDSTTRLSVSWTTDLDKSTGCFDLTCSGFVLVSQNIAMGGGLGNLTRQRGAWNYVISIKTTLDPTSGNWWLTVSDQEHVGYWPKDLFQGLSHSATIVQWGGEVYSKNVFSSPHTGTQMGNGEFADQDSAFVENIAVSDSSGKKAPPFPFSYEDQYDCYRAQFIPPVLYYGGPGKNPQCQ